MSRIVCAIMVTYNRIESLKIALEHIFNQSSEPAYIIILDNGSSDGTKEYLTSFHSKKNLICLFLPSNTGAAGGYHHAIAYTLENNINPDYFWMVEDDTYYEPDALIKLLDTIETSFYDMISLKGFEIGFSKSKKVVCSDKLQPINLALLDGSLIKAEIIRKIGAPKKQYFMMCEDYEFSLRMRKNGYKMALTSLQSANYLHLGGDGKFTRATLWRGYYSSRNHLLILREYFSVKDLFSYLYKQSKLLIAAALYAPDRFKRIQFRVVGMWHGIRGIQGKTLDPETLKFIKNK